MSQSQWKSSWRKVAKLNYEPMVNIKALAANEGERAIHEALKYSVKPDDLSRVNREQLFQLTNQLDGVHSVNKGGVLREYLKNVGSEDVDYIGSSYDSAICTGLELIQRFVPELNSYEYRLTNNSQELLRKHFKLAPL